VLILLPRLAFAAPPFRNSLDISPDIITSSDQSMLVQLVARGRAVQNVFDLRVAGGAVLALNVYVFDALYFDGRAIELHVNPEFSNAESEQQASRAARIIGQLPLTLRIHVRSVTIHRGTERFVGRIENGELVVYSGRADYYQAFGVLEEVYLHEAAHIALQRHHTTPPGFKEAQNADREYISDYAASLPDLEDVPESFLAYVALRYRPERITPDAAASTAQSITNRLRYFDLQSFDMTPLGVGTRLLPPSQVQAEVSAPTVTIRWTPPAGGTAPIGYQLSAGSAPGLADVGVVTVPESRRALTFDNVPTGTYFVRVRTLGPGGLGVSSPDVVVQVGCTLTAPPVEITASVSGSHVSLAWQLTFAPPTLSGFVIEAGSASGLANLAVITVSGDQRSFEASAPSGQYFVRMRSFSGCAVGAVSNEVVLTIF
jgi:hypothetical protein